MIVSKAEFNYYQDQTVQAVEIPLGRGNFNLLLIVPQSSESIGDICRKLDRNLLERINRKFRTKQLEVIMPEIEMKGIKSYRDIFRNSKLSSGFKEKLADFSKLSKSNNLFLSDIEQITDLNISRKEADSDFGSGSDEKENQGTILIDHPFVFVIYEKYSNGILFIGKIVSL
jgi:serine protease inhibitor